MRAGGCTVQQTLTSEAASVLKHSLSLARRRGHAQVTPLHVAATLLSSRVSLLRRACLKSHPHSSSHPLQCRALELCLNVALNRLPTTPGPLLHGQPSLSNALIAALKRAQAHQRRGCIEQQQQQPLLAIKVELEQLIISILDDPSVSRVMREAGFSSTSVKNNLEDSSASSVFQCYSSTNGILSSSPAEPIITHSSFWQTHFLNCSSDPNPLFFSPPNKNLMTPIFKESADKEEDLRLVVEVLLRKKKRNTVIVGDTFATTEGLVEILMGKVERGEVPTELRSAHFIKFQFPPVTLKFMKREDVEMKIADLRRKVGSLVSGGGAIIYAGDLKWAVEATSNERDVGGESSVHGYNPVEHLVSEIGRLLSDYNNSNSKVWLMGTASYQTYMRCQLKQPSLEIQWGLQAVSVPSGGLGLSLHASSGLDSRMTIIQNPPQMLETKLFAPKEEQDKLTCCAECTLNFEKDAGFLRSGQQKASNDLPYWLQPPKTESSCKDDLSELRRKWNRLCHSLHHPRPNQLHSSFNTQNLTNKSYNFASPYSWWPNSSQHNQESTSRHETSREFVSGSIDFGLPTGNPKDHSKGLRLDSLKGNENKDEKITLALGTSLLPEKREREIDPSVLNKQLQQNVPWQSEVIPSIAEALLKSKSNKSDGMTWLLIEGDDWFGKRRLAQTIAESLFVSPDNFVYMNLRRDNHAMPCSEILSEALRKQERCVVLIEEIDYADSHFLKLLSDACTKATFARVIFIVTKGDSSSSYESGTDVVQMKIYMEESLGSEKLICDHKRKAEWDSPNKAKNQKREDKGDPSSEHVFSCQSSSNTLDLNMLAEEEDNGDNEEIKTNNKTLNEFLGLVKNRFVFSRSPIQLSQMTENFMSRLKDSYQEVFGSEKGDYFFVDQLVIERIVNGSGILANLFEKWLKDVFQTSLQMVKKGGKEGVVRLSLDGKEDSGSENGYMGTNLPKIIPVALKE